MLLRFEEKKKQVKILLDKQLFLSAYAIALNVTNCFHIIEEMVHISKKLKIAKYGR